MAFNATLAHWNQSALGTLAQAEAYLADRVETTEWDALLDAAKQNLLVQSTRMLCAAYAVGGLPVYWQNVDIEGNILSATTTLPFNYNFKQALQVPKVTYESGEKLTYSSSTATSGISTTTLVDSGLADLYTDDFFNYGSILFTARDPYQMVEITDYAGTTGTFTVSGLTGDDISTSDTYVAIAPAPDALYWGVAEQANMLAAGRVDQRATMRRQGVASISTAGGSESYGTGSPSLGMIHPAAAEFWKPYKAKARLG